MIGEKRSHLYYYQSKEVWDMKNEDITKKLTLHNPEILGSGNFSKYAVLLPLLEKEDGIHVLLKSAHTN